MFYNIDISHNSLMADGAYVSFDAVTVIFFSAKHSLKEITSQTNT